MVFWFSWLHGQFLYAYRNFIFVFCGKSQRRVQKVVLALKERLAFVSSFKQLVFIEVYLYFSCLSCLKDLIVLVFCFHERRAIQDFFNGVFHKTRFFCIVFFICFRFLLRIFLVFLQTCFYKRSNKFQFRVRSLNNQRCLMR